MRIAVASSEQSLDSTVDFHTGRAPWFIVYDTNQETHEFIDNWSCFACLHWAGSKSVDTLVRASVRAVIVRHIGPNAFRLVKREGISVFLAEESSVADAVRLFREGKLPSAERPNCTGHVHLQ